MNRAFSSATGEPQWVRKSQTRLTQFDDQILALSARGVCTRDIVATFKEIYNAEGVVTLISKVTDAVLERACRKGNRWGSMSFIRSFTWIASYRKSARTNGPSTRPCIGRRASVLKVTRSAQACG